jgi:hypothetical protein
MNEGGLSRITADAAIQKNFSDWMNARRIQGIIPGK